jgi:hypothetical protein
MLVSVLPGRKSVRHPGGFWALREIRRERQCLLVLGFAARLDAGHQAVRRPA